jgi:hypothetical protein
MVLGFLAFLYYQSQTPAPPAYNYYPPQQQQYQYTQPVAPQTPATPNISNVTPNHLAYGKLIEQLRTWNAEAPDLTEVGTYGKSSRGQDIYYIRLTNMYDQTEKPKVLITACIHGNEPLSTSVTLSYIGKLLSEYGRDTEITELLNTRDIYFVPVVSPDSYPNSRHVDGVDPNRDFPTERSPDKQSVPPIEALKQFHLKMKFNAVMSGHTFGRVYLMPRGDSNERCPDDAAFHSVLDEMARLSNYRLIRACEMYGQPIYGGELDWFYKHGAFAFVCEYGTHQNIPGAQDTASEFNRTWKAFLVFLSKAPVALAN